MCINDFYGKLIQKKKTLKKSVSQRQLKSTAFDKAETDSKWSAAKTPHTATGATE